MNRSFTRRSFLRSAAVSASAAGFGFTVGWRGLPRVDAAEAKLPLGAVQFRPEIEPLVRVVEETARGELIEEMARRVKGGLSYREVLTALLLAGVRNIQPRPVGFKFHAVLVVNSAHLASLSSPDADRWLPIFWALDQFKQSQARDVQEGDWTMAPAREAEAPSSSAAAKQAFAEAMDRWDVEAADAAVAGLARTVGAQEAFEVFCRYGARDYRDIGHKAIFVSNAWRTLQCIGWRHAEPVLRSLAYALLAHEGSNPAERDAAPDRPGRRNLERLHEIREGWPSGREDSEAAADLLGLLRRASADEAAQKVVELLNRGVSPQTVWDALFQMAGELLMRRPGIVALHSVTTTNAMFYAFQQVASDETRRFLLLQNASFLPLFRGAPDSLGDGLISRLEAEEGASVASVFEAINGNRALAARRALGCLRGSEKAREFIDTARRLIFLKGTNSHDYKFSSAVLEDYYHASPSVRAAFLASSVYNLRGAGGSDTELARRIRDALA